jgi:tRNA pseudouridine55 synthase
MTAPDGILVVDKPEDWTSHDVVARCRRLAATRRVGHAGTLDPMATGVLVLGIGRATRLLGHLALTSKAYDATIRLGQTTLTDDARGDTLAAVDASHLGRTTIKSALGPLRGDIMQIPSAVSAIKINGERAYKRVRDGETVELAARPVRVSELSLIEVTAKGAVQDLRVHVECSSGTYVRALARDLGVALGVGGHLTALRRTRVGDYSIDEAHPIDELEQIESELLPVESIADVAKRSFPWVSVGEDDVAAVRNGRVLHRRLAASAEPATSHEASADEVEAVGPIAVFAPSGEFLALYDQHGPVAKAVAVFDPA